MAAGQDEAEVSDRLGRDGDDALVMGGAGLGDLAQEVTHTRQGPETKRGRRRCGT